MTDESLEPRHLRHVADWIDTLSALALRHVEAVENDPFVLSVIRRQLTSTGVQDDLRRWADELQDGEGQWASSLATGQIAPEIEQYMDRHEAADDASRYEGMRPVHYWQQLFGYKVIDPDGWRYLGIEFDTHELMSAEKFVGLSQNSTISNMLAWGKAREALGNLGIMSPFPPKPFTHDHDQCEF